jgi:hypothetical protein
VHFSYQKVILVSLFQALDNQVINTSISNILSSNHPPQRPPNYAKNVPYLLEINARPGEPPIIFYLDNHITELGSLRQSKFNYLYLPGPDVDQVGNFSSISVWIR